jgi:hypothetical protein
MFLKNILEHASNLDKYLLECQKEQDGHNECLMSLHDILT